MQRASLQAILSTVVAATAASACGGDCPHEVIDRETLRQISASEACALESQGVDLTGAPMFAACQQACGDKAVTRCSIPANYQYSILHAPPDWDAGGVQACPPIPGGHSTIGLDCVVSHSEGTPHHGCPVEGRRPQGFVLQTASHSSARCVGTYFALGASLERASVLAFQLLRDELRAHGAPSSLVHAAARSAREEARHARLMGALARKYGVHPATTPLRRHAPRSLRALALDNAVEGVVRETFGAAVALWRAQHADDPDVRTCMREIAADECGHAALAWRVDEWARAGLSARDCRAVDGAVHAAIDELAASVSGGPRGPRNVTFAGDPPPLLRKTAGVPNARQALELLRQLRGHAWRLVAASAQGGDPSGGPRT